MKINFNMRIDADKLRKLFVFNFSRRSLLDFFYKKLQWLALLIILLSAGFLIFLWYNYIFASQWDDARVQEYIQIKKDKNEAVFNRENFEKIIQESNARNTEFEKPLDNLEDIFRLKQ
ncbi:MAG: hypothetical protein COX29_01055 [Candidatus Moranbacteria bacterium CG23_combo_of_CG06-09_8_20_14_all_35_22]|nr:MAG: hypothetical protein COX29_01055 [Candidatus Moranbacteria bacterium CG23_combo_of_CG06-09_8_20_14_all_35_22]